MVMTQPTVQEKIDTAFMREALVLAEKAARANEVPVGAVVVLNNQIIGRAHNRTVNACDPSAHAEVLALRDAARYTSNHRLPESTLYVTLEPCLMCCGCMLHARIARVVYGVREPRTGAVVSVNEALADRALMHHISVTEGVLSDECQVVLQRFFSQRR